MASVHQRKSSVFFAAARALPLFVLLGANPALAQHSAEPACSAPPELQRKTASHPTAAAYDALGTYFGQSDNYACAIPAFRSALQLEPKSWRTHSYLGLALLASGNPAQAARELQDSLELNPNQPQGHMTLGAALVQLNQMDTAIEQFKVVLKTDPKSITALDWMAKALISEERYAAAIALLTRAPADQVLRMDLVVAYSKEGNNEQAIQILSQMIKEHPTSSVPHFGLGTVYTQQNRLEDAAAEFKEAFRLNPKDDATRISYAKLLILMSDFQAALPVAQSLLRDHPEEFDGQYLMGVIERQRGNEAKAEELLENAVRLSPEHFDARYNLGVALIGLGKIAEARPQLEKAVQLDPSSGEARFRFANVLRSLGMKDEAAAQFEIYQRNIREGAKKDVAVNKANQAAQFLAKGEIQRAVELYREAVEEDPKNANMFYNLALALDRKGDYAGEREALKKAVEIDSGFARAHNQVGFLAFQAGQPADAEKEYKIAVSLDSHYAEAKNNLGFLYGQQGHDGEAERMFRQAIEDDPGYAAAYVNLAVSLASQSRFVEAQSALQEASRLDPGNENARAVREQIQAQLSQRK